MAKSEPSGRLSPEAEDIITLGELLKRPRNEEQHRIVDGIVASSLTVREKIQEIQNLDAGGKQVTNEEGDEVRRTSPLRYRLPALADIIKRPYSRTPYLSFLFGDYLRIRNFGKFAGVFEQVYFPPNVRLTRTVLLILNRDLRQWAAEFAAIISEGLEDSWHYLRKIEYNVLVVMKQLCEKISSVNFNLFDCRDPYIINKLRSLETLFLVFHYREDYQQMLQLALQQIGNNDPRVGDKYEAAIDLMHKILHFDGSNPSLYNIILGLNMFKYRRYLNMIDLLCTDLGELINTKDFACPPEVKERIRAIVADGMLRLQELRSQLEETNKIKTFLSLDESGEVSFTPLQSLYEQQQIGVNGYSFAADSEDMVCFAPRLFDILDRTFAPLLNGQIDIDDVGSVTLFPHDFFQLEFLRLRRITGRVWDGGEEKFPLSRFLDLQHSAKGIQNLEAEILRQVNEGIEVLLGMAKKVETVLNTRKNGRGKPPGPLDPMILQGKKFSIPHEKRSIVSGGILHGKRVVEAMQYCVGVCYTIAVFCHYLPVYTPLEEEPRQTKELKSQLELLNRLSGRKPSSG
jgi:hypothetical protein